MVAWYPVVTAQHARDANITTAKRGKARAFIRLFETLCRIAVKDIAVNRINTDSAETGILFHVLLLSTEHYVCWHVPSISCGAATATTLLRPKRGFSRPATWGHFEGDRTTSTV